MKKIYLAFFGILAMGAVNAQITVTHAANTPSIGDSFNYLTDLAPVVNISHDGANQIWDLSNLNNNSQETYSYVDVSTGADASNFTNSNILENTQGGESYFISNASELTFEGHYIPGQARIVYTDKRELVKFPMTFNSQYFETFAGDLENLSVSQTFYRSGSISIIGTGYGDLILPNRTVNNVLKVTIVSDYTDEYGGVTLYTYSDTTILWYNATNKNFLANYSISTANGSVLLKRVTYMDDNDIISSTNNLLNSQSPLSFYPNPAYGQITLSNTNSINLVTIKDIKGITVKTIQIRNDNQTVDISELASGMYIIQYTSNSQTFTEKLLVQ